MRATSAVEMSIGDWCVPLAHCVKLGLKLPQWAGPIEPMYPNLAPPPSEIAEKLIEGNKTNRQAVET